MCNTYNSGLKSISFYNIRLQQLHCLTFFSNFYGWSNLPLVLVQLGPTKGQVEPKKVSTLNTNY